MTAPRRLSHYELHERIGGDAETEIYRARDLRLDRDVALRLLRAEPAMRGAAVERFRLEARYASIVSHPHIFAVHDSGEEGGHPFVVCELLQGQPLAAALEAGALPLPLAIEYGIQLTDALAAAHRRGLFHGDVRPSQVFLTSDGHVKLLGLGVAAAGRADRKESADPSRTTAVDVAGVAAGARELDVHPYRAPELIAGDAVDHRVDIFSAGAVLYHMITGRSPFPSGAAAATAAALMAGAVTPPRRHDPRIPRAVEAILLRALARDPAGRYASAADMLADLRGVRTEPDVEVRGNARWRLRLAAAAVICVAAALALAGYARSRWAPRPDGEPRTSLLLGEVANATGDPAFDGTLREAMAVYLAQSPDLDLASDERIRRTLELMGRDPGARMPHAVASDVCQRLGLQALLEGSVAPVGRTFSLALVATDCRTDEVLAREGAEVARQEDVLAALGPLTASVRRALGESRATLARHDVPLAEATTPSLEALKAYTEGLARRASGSETDAVAFLERAIALDPQFALAYATLSTVYGNLGETGRSAELARLAYDRRGHVSERERLFITYQYHDRVTGDQLKVRETLEVWLRTYPRDYRPANALAVLLNRLGDYEGAVAAADEAIRRNPAHSFPYSNLAHAHRGAGRYARAREIAEGALARKLGTAPLRRLLFQLAVMDGQDALADAQLEWAAHSPLAFDFTGARAQIAAFQGRLEDARRLYAETVDAASRRALPQTASGYAAQAALTEAVYGETARAAAAARQVLASARAHEPRLRAATALALAGDTGSARPVVERAAEDRPGDTLLRAAYVAPAEAALALQQGRPEAALEALRRSAGYEHGVVAALVPGFLRARAHLEGGQTREAAAAFRDVIAFRGADPFSPLIPCAQLGLARALAAAGEADASRRAYDELMHIWKDAPPGIAVIDAARRERDGLGSAGPPPAAAHAASAPRTSP